MEKKPLLSIITICYRDINNLRITSHSIPVHDQIEWVVVDGGSDDGTREFLQTCPTVSTFISEKDAGIYDAMNKGTRLSSGSYLIYMNAGDVFHNLDCVIEEIGQASDFDLLFFDAKFTYGSVSRTRPARHFSYVKYGMPANHQAICFKREVLLKTPYVTDYKICGDYKLLCDLSLRSLRYKVINKTAANFAVGGISTILWATLIKEAYLIQRHTLNLSFTYCCYSYLRRAAATLITLGIFRLSNPKTGWPHRILNKVTSKRNADA